MNSNLEWWWSSPDWSRVPTWETWEATEGAHVKPRVVEHRKPLSVTIESTEFLTSHLIICFAPICSLWKHLIPLPLKKHLLNQIKQKKDAKIHMSNCSVEKKSQRKTSQLIKQKKYYHVLDGQSYTVLTWPKALKVRIEKGDGSLTMQGIYANQQNVPLKIRNNLIYTQ